MKSFLNRRYFDHWTDGPKVFIDVNNEYDLEDVRHLLPVNVISCDVSALEAVIETFPSLAATFYVNCDADVMRLLISQFRCGFIWVTDVDPMAAYH